VETITDSPAGPPSSRGGGGNLSRVPGLRGLPKENFREWKGAPKRVFCPGPQKSYRPPCSPGSVRR
jgi:hypothetical protein